MLMYSTNIKYESCVYEYISHCLLNVAVAISFDCIPLVCVWPCRGPVPQSLTEFLSTHHHSENMYILDVL